MPNAAALPVVGDFASVDTERIIALHPDVVVGIPSQARLVAPLQRAGIRVVLIPDDSYDDIFRDLRTLGDVTGHARAGAGRDRASAARDRAFDRERSAPRVPSVGFCCAGHRADLDRWARLLHRTT